jgi:uncharacterized protein with HEPN domain
MPHSAAKLLEDIRQAAHYILNDTAGATLASYQQDRRLRQLAERNFEIIGEARRRLSDLDLEAAARISGRREIIAFRNVLIHGYDVIDHAEVWRIIEHPLPLLKSEVDDLLREGGAP